MDFISAPNNLRENVDAFIKQQHKFVVLNWLNCLSLGKSFQSVADIVWETRKWHFFLCLLIHFFDNFGFFFAYIKICLLMVKSIN